MAICHALFVNEVPSVAVRPEHGKTATELLDAELALRGGVSVKEHLELFDAEIEDITEAAALQLGLIAPKLKSVA